MIRLTCKDVELMRWLGAVPVRMNRAGPTPVTIDGSAILVIAGHSPMLWPLVDTPGTDREAASPNTN
jgi:hypothetical protein